MIEGAAGAERSSANVSFASVEMFPAGSLARTRKVYVASGSAERSNVRGLAQTVQSTTTVAPRVTRQL